MNICLFDDGSASDVCDDDAGRIRRTDRDISLLDYESASENSDGDAGRISPLLDDESDSKISNDNAGRNKYWLGVGSGTESEFVDDDSDTEIESPPSESENSDSEDESTGLSEDLDTGMECGSVLARSGKTNGTLQGDQNVGTPVHDEEVAILTHERNITTRTYHDPFNIDVLGE